MAWLVPSTMKVDEIRPHSEGRVVQILIDKLSADWVVMPKVLITVNGQNAEIDVVIASRTRGVFFLEVKGGPIRIRDGQWFGYLDTPRQHPVKNPIEQLMNARHQLVKRLRLQSIDLNDLYMRDLVVLPDVGGVPDIGLGPGVPPETILTKLELEDPEAAIGRFVREHAPIPLEQFKSFVHALCPNVTLTAEGGNFHQNVLHRVDEATANRLGALVGLSTNRRVLATGAAGTGKTYLAERWARQCAERGERTLLVCYNVPLAEDLAQRLEDSDVDVFGFHRLARAVLGPTDFVVPPEASQEWWDTVPAQQLIERSAATSMRYDTIVVDEGQDFRPTWWDALDTLFSPDGPRRLLVVADPLQAIYMKPWVAPPNMMQVPLEVNVRSTRAVSNHVKLLGGAEPNAAAPTGVPVRQLTATPDTVVEVVSREVARLVGEFALPPMHVAILTSHRVLRDHLLAAEMPVKLARWADRDEDTIICETIHRVKGLERLAIIVVDLDEERPRELDYIGSSRAVLHLTVVTR